MHKGRQREARGEKRRSCTPVVSVALRQAADVEPFEQLGLRERIDLTDSIA